MSFTFFSHRAVAVVRWDTPEEADIEALVSRLAAIARVSGAGADGVVFVQCIAGGAPPPSREVATEMARRLRELAEPCASLHAVFEGRPDAVRFKRAWLTGMLLAANLRRREDERVEILAHDALDDVAHHVPLGRAREVRAILRSCGEADLSLEARTSRRWRLTA